MAYLEGKPEILCAWAAAKIVATTTKLVAAHYVRCNEFQADRIAAQVTHNPRALASSLQIMEACNEKVEPLLAKLDYTRGPLILRPYRRAKALFANHPHTNLRCARLEKMAKFLDRRATAEPA